MLRLRQWTRHTKVLILAGALYLAIGITNLITAKELKLSPRMKYAFQIFPPETWGFIFIGFGSLAVLAGLTKHHREAIGYQLLSGLAWAWTAIFAYTYVHTGKPVDLLSTITWLMIGGMWIGISGLISPEDIPYPLGGNYDQRD